MSQTLPSDDSAEISTGSVERLPLDCKSPWWGEHCSRYRFAQHYVNGKDVLDIACGSGFGAEMLAQAGARSVVGVDVDAETLAVARRNCHAANVQFQVGDGTRLLLNDVSFDVVCSFETIEHIPQYEDFVKELRRVTRPGGMLILSTPNVLVTRCYPRNPFHVHEFMTEELRELLARHYHSVEMRGQFLADHFRIAPFLPGREHARSAFDHVRLAAWKISNRFPFAVKDRLARLVTGHSFYPTDNDYRFEASVNYAHVQLAICRA